MNDRSRKSIEGGREMKSVLMSINSLHNVNIESGLKLSELRTRPPKLKPPFKVYTYESGALGRHKVVNEWICSDMETWRMCMGIPAHLSKNACVSNEYIWKYSNNGYKDITEMKISDLVIYDKPKDLSEFFKVGHCEYCKSEWEEREKFRIQLDKHNEITGDKAHLNTDSDFEKILKLLSPFKMKRPPQSWCYVEGKEDEGK